MALDDRLRQAGRARRVEDPERVVERHALELSSEPSPAASSSSHASAPSSAELGSPPGTAARPSLERRHLALQLGDDVELVEVAPAVAIAVDGEQHLGLDLREAVDDRARAEVRRAARPDRADARDGEERRDRLGDVRHVGDDAVARPTPRRAGRRDRRRQRAQLAPRDLVRLAALAGRDDRDARVAAPAEDVLGVIERDVREPARPRHRALGEHRAGRRRPVRRSAPRRRPRSRRDRPPTSARAPRTRAARSPGRGCS